MKLRISENTKLFAENEIWKYLECIHCDVIDGLFKVSKIQGNNQSGMIRLRKHLIQHENEMKVFDKK